MRKLIATIAVLAMVDSVAIAQTAGSRNPDANPSTNSGQQQQLLPGGAPVGHRQPRADQVPSEKDAVEDPNDSINRENAQLDPHDQGHLPRLLTTGLLTSPRPDAPDGEARPSSR
jgi:hypothetical protein